MAGCVLALSMALTVACPAATSGASLDGPVAVRFGVTPALRHPPSEVWVTPAGEDREGWPIATRVPVTSVDGDVIVALAPGTDALLFIPAEAHTYVLVGPIRWPAEPDRRLIVDVRRYSIRLDAGGLVEALTWVGAQADASGWPRCRQAGKASWQCVGVPANGGGVFVGHVGEQWVAAAVHSSQAGETGNPALELSPFTSGVLVVLDAPAHDDACTARAWQVQASAVLASTPYAMLVSDQRVAIAPVERQAFWVSSRDQFGIGTSLRLTCPDAVARIDGPALGAASPLLPLRVSPLPVVTARVIVGGASAVPGAGASVDVFAEPDPRRRTSDARGRWERVAGVVADASGVALVDSLPRGRYEFRATHPQLGSRSVVTELNGRDIRIELRPARRITGRVTRDGMPAGGVPVRVLPPLEAIVGSPRALDFVIPVVLADNDGRFEVAVPAGVPLEVSVGEPPGALRRVALAAGDDGDVVNMGDINLSAPVAVSASVSLPPGCELAAVGPLGRTGLSLVPGERSAAAEWRLLLPEAGRWHVSGLCGSRELPLAPPLIDVPEHTTEWGVVLTSAPAR